MSRSASPQPAPRSQDPQGLSDHYQPEPRWPTHVISYGPVSDLEAKTVFEDPIVIDCALKPTHTYPVFVVERVERVDAETGERARPGSPYSMLEGVYMEKVSAEPFLRVNRSDRQEYARRVDGEGGAYSIFMSDNVRFYLPSGDTVVLECGSVDPMLFRFKGTAKVVDFFGPGFDLVFTVRPFRYNLAVLNQPVGVPGSKVGNRIKDEYLHAQSQGRSAQRIVKYIVFDAVVNFRDAHGRLPQHFNQDDASSLCNLVLQQLGHRCDVYDFWSGYLRLSYNVEDCIYECFPRFPRLELYKEPRVVVLVSPSVAAADKAKQPASKEVRFFKVDGSSVDYASFDVHTVPDHAFSKFPCFTVKADSPELARFNGVYCKENIREQAVLRFSKVFPVSEGPPVYVLWRKNQLMFLAENFRATLTMPVRIFPWAIGFMGSQDITVRGKTTSVEFGMFSFFSQRPINTLTVPEVLEGRLVLSDADTGSSLSYGMGEAVNFFIVQSVLREMARNDQFVFTDYIRSRALESLELNLSREQQAHFASRHDIDGWVELFRVFFEC